MPALTRRGGMRRDRDLEQLTGLVRTFEEGWSHLDFALLESAWGLECQHLYYLSEIFPPPLRISDEVRHYWEDSQLRLERIPVRASDLYLSTVGRSTSVIAFLVHTEAVLKGFDVQGFCPLGTGFRASAICRLHRANWRIFRYVESPLAPLACLRRIYNQIVSIDFMTLALWDRPELALEA